MTGYVNVRDHFDPDGGGDDWAPAFAAAIAVAKDTSRGVFVPAAAEDYTVRKPGPKLPSIDLRGLTDFRLVGEGEGSRIRMLGSGPMAVATPHDWIDKPASGSRDPRSLARPVACPDSGY